VVSLTMNIRASGYIGTKVLGISVRVESVLYLCKLIG